MHQTIEAAGSSPDSHRGMLKKSQGITRNFPTLYHEEKKGKHNQHWQYTVSRTVWVFPDIPHPPSPKITFPHKGRCVLYSLPICSTVDIYLEYLSLAYSPPKSPILNNGERSVIIPWASIRRKNPGPHYLCEQARHSGRAAHPLPYTEQLTSPHYLCEQARHSGRAAHLSPIQSSSPLLYRAAHLSYTDYRAAHLSPIH